jgi:small subunit ribosomal protein S7
MSKNILHTNKKNLYLKFVGFLIKKGNKINAKKIIEHAFSKISKKTKISAHHILKKVFLKLNSFVEIKKIRIRRRTHFVPFYTNSKRKLYLAVKWIIQSVQENRNKVSFSEKLFLEVYDIIKKRSSKTFKKRNLNISQALLNKSNIHYRW